MSEIEDKPNLTILFWGIMKVGAAIGTTVYSKYHTVPVPYLTFATIVVPFFLWS